MKRQLSTPTMTGSTDPCVGSRLEIRWTSTVSRWSDPFGACVDPHPAHGRVVLVLTVDLPGSDTGSGLGRVNAWLETESERRPLLEQAVVTCVVERDCELTHVEIEHADGNLATLTVNGQARVLYARTRFLADIGMSAGRIDPPTVRWQAIWPDDNTSAGAKRACDLPQPHDVQ